MLSSASCSSHYSGNVLILGLCPTCMHNTFQQHPSWRTSRFTILEWVIFQENHGMKTLRTPPSQEDNKLSSLAGQEEVLTSLVMGCLWIYHNVIIITHIQQYLQEKTDNQYLWWWLGKKMISVLPLFSRAPVSISARNQQHTQSNILQKSNEMQPHQSEHMQISQEAKTESKIGAVHKVSGLSRATSQNLSRFEVRERHYWAIQAFQGIICLKVCAFVARLWWVHSTLESSFESKDSQMEPMLWNFFQKCNPKPLPQSCCHGSQKLLCHNNKSLKVETRILALPKLPKIGWALNISSNGFLYVTHSEEAWQTLG